MSASGPFATRTVIWGITASVFALAAFLVLATYAPDFRSSPPGAATADAKAGNGYAGLVALLDLVGEKVELVDYASDDVDLLVVPIDPSYDIDRLTELADLRAENHTVFILPKWIVTPRRDDPAKMQRLDKIGHERLARLAEAVGAELPHELRDGAVPIAIADHPHWLVIDADTMNNAGLKSRATAAAAVRMIVAMKEEPEDAIAFDLSLARAPKTQSIGKLLLEPPFLALTLSLLVAAALAFLGGIARFGPPLGEARALRFGKRALADATARLMRRGNRIDGLGDHYADTLRARAAVLMQAPPGLGGEALTRWLDARDGGDARSFTQLTESLRDARGETQMLTAGRRLYRWIEGKTRDR